MSKRFLVRAVFCFCAFLSILLLIGGFFSPHHLFGFATGLVMGVLAIWINEPYRAAFLDLIGQHPTSPKETVIVGVTLLLLFGGVGHVLAPSNAKRVDVQANSVVSTPAAVAPEAPKAVARSADICEVAKSSVLSAADTEGVCLVMKRMLDRSPTDDELQSVMATASKAAKSFNDAPTDVASQVISIVKLRGLIGDSQGIAKTTVVLDKLATAPEAPMSPANVVRYLSDHQNVAKNIGDEALLNIKATIARDKVYSEDQDSMTGKLTKMESFESSNTVDFAFPYQGGTRARLLLRNHPQYGKDVILEISKGQLMCHSFSNCSVSISIDGGPVFAVNGVGAADGSSTSVFMKWSLVSKLKGAKSIKIQPPTFQNGQPVFEFDLTGIDISRVN